MAEEVAPSYQFIDEIAANQVALIESLFGYILDAKAAPENDKEQRSPDAMVSQLREDLRLM